jgi:hypothetical protein
MTIKPDHLRLERRSVARPDFAQSSNRRRKTGSHDRIATQRAHATRQRDRQDALRRSLAMIDVWKSRKFVDRYHFNSLSNRDS